MHVYCYCSVTQSCPTLCDTMDCSTPGLSILHHLPKFAQVHVHCISDAIQPAISSSDALFSFCPQSFPASGTFPMSQLFASGDQNTGVSASASSFQQVFRVDFPWDWLVWFPCCPRESQESSPAPQFKGINMHGCISYWFCFSGVPWLIRSPSMNLEIALLLVNPCWLFPP